MKKGTIFRERTDSKMEGKKAKTMEGQEGQHGQMVSKQWYILTVPHLQTQMATGPAPEQFE